MLAVLPLLLQHRPLRPPCRRFGEGGGRQESEQELYDETTDYIRDYYNRARVLNRSAAQLAMSVFQRLLASSTYAMVRSFERRKEKLEGLIDDILDPHAKGEFSKSRNGSGT